MNPATQIKYLQPNDHFETVIQAMLTNHFYVLISHNPTQALDLQSNQHVQLDPNTFCIIKQKPLTNTR